MPLLALADVRQTTCHPPRALPFGIIPTRPSCFYFHHPIPVCKVWNGFSRKRMSHFAGLGASVQVSGQKLWRFRGIYHHFFDVLELQKFSSYLAPYTSW